MRGRKKSSGWMGTAKHVYNDAVSVGKAAYKGYQLAKTAIGLINAEHKYIDTAVSTTNASITGSQVLLNATAEGDGSANRDGNSIKCTDMFFKAYLNRGTVDNVIRISVIKVNMVNGTGITLSQVFESGSNNLSSYNKDFMGQQFQILYDKFVVLDTYRPSVMIKKKLKLGFHTKYSGTGGTTADMATGGIFILFWGLSNAATPGTYQLYNRVNFLDN